MSLFHRHHWTLVAAQRGVLTHYRWRGGKVGESDATALLYRCECGDVKEDTIEGHWTVAQLAGQPSGNAQRETT